MDSELPEERPVSPKKKLRPNSSANSEVSNSDSVLNATDEKDSVGSKSDQVVCNGLAPTRSGRGVSPISSTSNTVSSPAERDSVTPSSQIRPTDTQKRSSNIQEEEVSSSENAVGTKQPTNYAEGDADSLTNGEADTMLLIREADAK